MTLQQAYLTVSERIPVSDIKVHQRLDRAYDIVRAQGSGYDIVQVQSDAWQVNRASTALLEDNSASYDVTLSECSCPDFPTARGGLCKHRLAIMLLVEMERKND